MIQLAKKVIRRLLRPFKKQEVQIGLSQEDCFYDGYEVFLKTGETPPNAFMANINLYCSTNGAFNEAFNERLKLTNPALSVSSNLQGVTGSYTTTDFEKVNNEMNKKGYVHFDKKLSKDICDNLYRYALQTPAVIPPKYDSRIIYTPENPLAEIYRFDMQDLVNNEEVQQLMMDPVLLNFARNYLGCEPIFDFPAMWWSTSFQKEASSEAAQLYHFDMDRVKWLKVFFYINDVTMENGPHCYIEGSHQVGAKSLDLLARGYARIPDTDLQPYYKPEAFKVVCGDAGSIFIGDTKCWHKGAALKKGHRLVLELEYTSSLFVANYTKLIVNNSSKAFKDFCTENKIFASNIQFKN